VIPLVHYITLYERYHFFGPPCRPIATIAYHLTVGQMLYVTNCNHVQKASIDGQTCAILKKSITHCWCGHKAGYGHALLMFTGMRPWTMDAPIGTYQGITDVLIGYWLPECIAITQQILNKHYVSFYTILLTYILVFVTEIVRFNVGNAITNAKVRWSADQTQLATASQFRRLWYVHRRSQDFQRVGELRGGSRISG